MNYETQYQRYHEMVEDALAERLAASKSPEPLLGAMRYSLLAGGKRLRPVMLLAACEMAGGSAQRALPFACALEMIHTYSLIHDDLPAMDDDDMRRGRPTNHKVYGEGMAVLAGDGLLSMAFETMLDGACKKSHVRALQCIARAAGTEGMLAGQCVDVTSEQNHTGDADEVAYIDRHKTADLFVGAVEAGLSLGRATPEQLRDGAQYARAFGIAFQVQDDLLDIEGDAALLGKATGMDEMRGKLTYPGVHGMEAARRAVRELTQIAVAALAPFGERAAFLTEMAERMLERNQ